MKTTVIIPNYNGKKFLKNCLDSVTKSDVDASIIVVDNGSLDGSRQLATEYGERVRLICFSENKGFCQAVNAGILAAETPYVFLLNNDTVIAKDCIRQLEAVMDRRPNCFSVGAKMVVMADPDRIDGVGDLYSAFGWAYAVGKDKMARHYEKSMRVFSNCAGAALYRKAYLEKTGLFDPLHFAYLEDVDLGYRARIAGYENVTAPAAVVCHAGSGFSGSRYNTFKITHSAKNNVYLIYKNMPWPQLVLNLPFLAAGFLIKQLFFMKKGFGRVYWDGIKSGLRLCCSQEGRAKKVRFLWKNLGHYVQIQLELWVNLFRRI